MQHIEMSTQDFLHFIQPGGPWWLSANAQVGKTIVEPLDLGIWLSANASNNIYYTINHVAEGTKFDSRPGKAQIDVVNFLHTDIDPDEKRDAKKIFNQLKKYDPQPTAIVFSGGGCQALWHIHPFSIKSPGDIKFVESRNRFLKVSLHGDSTIDISRIFRLPGTTNHPNAKKRAKGQTEKVAEVWYFNESNLYTLEEMPSYEIPNISEVSWVPPDKPVPIPKDIIENLPNRLQAELHYSYEKGFRSEPLFSCIMSLLEYRVPSDIIYSILLSRDFNISDSIYSEDDNQPRRNPEQYAARQVIRALERFVGIEEEPTEDYDDSPEYIRQFRYISQYYVKILHFSNKCRVLRKPTSPEENYSIMSKEEFFAATSHLWHVDVTQGKRAKMIYTAKEWFDNPNAPYYQSAKFAPGITLEDDVYNFFQGFSYPAKPGNWQMFKDFIENIICSGNKQYRDYIICWMANAVQHMATPGQTAIVLYGDRGLGKSFFPDMFGKLFGRHYRATFDPFGKFNAKLAETILLFGDEVNAFGPANEARLKLMVTQPVIEIEYKGIDSAPFNNCLHIILATNPDKAVPAGLDERRFFVLRVDKSNKKPRRYFDAIEDQLNNGGFSGMLYDLLSLDITNWNPQEDMPSTEYLSEQKLRNASPIEMFWHSILVRGYIEQENTWSETVPKDMLFEMYLDFCRDHTLDFLPRDIFYVTFFRMVPGTSQARRLVSTGGKSKKRMMVVELPTLQQCRAQWPIDLGWETDDVSDATN